MSKSVTQKLKIKTGSCNRCYKEYNLYKVELQKETERLVAMENKGEEETKLKQQQSVIEETKQMIPNTQSRLQQAYNDLKKFIEDECVGDSSVEESEEYKNALAILSTVEESTVVQ